MSRQISGSDSGGAGATGPYAAIEVPRPTGASAASRTTGTTEPSVISGGSGATGTSSATGTVGTSETSNAAGASSATGALGASGTSPDLPALGSESLDDPKFKLELRRIELDAALRREEMADRQAARAEERANQDAVNELKEKELTAASGSGFRFTTGQSTVIAAVVGFLSAIFGGLIQSYFNRDVEFRKSGDLVLIEGRKVDAEIEVEKLRARSAVSLAQQKQDADQAHEKKQFQTKLILQATQSLDLATRISNLTFFVQAGLLDDPEGKIADLIKKGNVPESKSDFTNSNTSSCGLFDNWTYSQTTGLLCHNGQRIAVGYSGSGSKRNNPTSEAIPGGTIPKGDYAISEPHDISPHFPFALGLTPSSNNSPHFRTGLTIHGESASALGNSSEGSIILPRAARELIWSSNDHLLHVIE